MDAACAASALVGLLFNCATAVQQCNDLRGKYKNADQTLRSIATQGSTLRTSIHQLQHLMLRDPAALSSRWDIESMLPQTFETAIDTFNAVLLALLQELEKFNGKAGLSAGSSLTRGLRIKLLWNESMMQDILIQLRDQQRSLHFLLTILQMETISDIRNRINENQELLKKIAHPTRKLERTPSDLLKRKVRSIEEDEKSSRSQDKDKGENDTNSEDYEDGEPPTKRRSLSPEEKNINASLSPPRTRSGKIYHQSNDSGFSALTASNLGNETTGGFDFTPGFSSLKGKQSQNTTNRNSLRSRDQRQERRRNSGRYSLGRSLSPASSTLSSPVAQSASIAHMEASPKGWLASPTFSQTHDSETTHYLPNHDRKKKHSPNHDIGRKQVDSSQSHSLHEPSHTKPVNNLAVNLVPPDRVNGDYKTCIDSKIATDDHSATSQKLRTSNNLNYRSPQVCSDSEDDFIKPLPDKASITIQDYTSPSISTKTQLNIDDEKKFTQLTEKPSNDMGLDSSFIFTAVTRREHTDRDIHPVLTPKYESPPRRRRQLPFIPERPPTTKPSSSNKEETPVPKATEADALKHRIPTGYSLKHWDPSEEPIILLSSVFDANSLGKWIYDWTVYRHGSATPISDMAGEFWLLIIQLAGKTKRAEECMPRIRLEENQEMVDDFVESAERLNDKLNKLLKACETPMLKAGKRTDKTQLGKNAGVAFVDSMFGRDQQLGSTEKLMASIRLWNLRFDANCEDILRTPGQ